MCNCRMIIYLTFGSFNLLHLSIYWIYKNDSEIYKNDFAAGPQASLRRPLWLSLQWNSVWSWGKNLFLLFRHNINFPNFFYFLFAQCWTVGWWFLTCRCPVIRRHARPATCVWRATPVTAANSTTVGSEYAKQTSDQPLHQCLHNLLCCVALIVDVWIFTVYSCGLVVGDYLHYSVDCIRRMYLFF